MMLGKSSARRITVCGNIFVPVLCGTLYKITGIGNNSKGVLGTGNTEDPERFTESNAGWSDPSYNTVAETEVIMKDVTCDVDRLEVELQGEASLVTIKVEV